MVLGANAEFKKYEKWARTIVDMIEYGLLPILI